LRSTQGIDVAYQGDALACRNQRGHAAGHKSGRLEAVRSAFVFKVDVDDIQDRAVLVLQANGAGEGREKAVIRAAIDNVRRVSEEEPALVQ
jgi:hypothetical protein